MARVVLENLTKVFKGPGGEEVCAVDHANLAVEDKEFMVLVGPSGCGKTTTLRMIAGLEEVSEGTISIDDKIVNEVEPKDRDIAMVFQNYALYPHMSVYENMAFGLKLRKYANDEIDRRVKDAAQILDLSGCLDRKPKELSGGQRQRVAVGRAIVRKPKVFLFDEPLSNLDAKMRVQMRTEISKLHTRLAATMIYVTHDQVEAMTMGDRIVVMNEGVIQQVADPITLYRNPANVFVAGFIGSPPMNFFKGQIRNASGGLMFEEQGARAGDGPKGFTVGVDQAMVPSLTPYVGKEVVLGIRPENISDQLHASQVPARQMVEAVAEVVEPMGPETYLYLASASHSFVARIHTTNRVNVNQNVSLLFEMQQAHFFDPSTEKTIV